jgi:predicted dinucleotide-binding enzyme
LDQVGDVSGKVIVCCSLPLNAQNTKLVLGHTTLGAEELAKKVPGAEVTAAFNNVPSEGINKQEADNRTRLACVFCVCLSVIEFDGL